MKFLYIVPKQEKWSLYWKAYSNSFNQYLDIQVQIAVITQFNLEVLIIF